MSGPSASPVVEAASAEPVAPPFHIHLRRRLSVASVCTIFPSGAEPHKGVFVARRVSCLARLADVRATQPVPWFPVLRPSGASGPCSDGNALPIHRQKMFYLPGAFKRLDGNWLAHSIYPILKRWRDESGLDLVDAHFGFPEGVGCVLAAGRLGIPAFITLRGNEQVYLRQPAICRKLVDALHACRGIIAVSQGLREAAVAAGVDARKVCVIPNAVDRGQYCPGDKQAARAQLGLPLHSPIIVSVGQLVSGKGHHFLARAVNDLRRHHPDVLLAVVGGAAYERDYPRQLRGLIDAFDLNANVRLAGPQSPAQVATWLRAADVFALCTEREGCCNAILEALACGTPVVTTDVGDNRVYVDPPTNGLLVAPDDTSAVSAALGATLQREWNPHDISNRLPQRDWEAVARATIHFFETQLQTGSNAESAAKS